MFLRDRIINQTRKINLRFGSQQSLAPIVEPHVSISADGRYVAFASADGDLVVNQGFDNNGTLDVYVFDRFTNQLSRIDVGRSGGSPIVGDGPSGWPTLSADGRYVSLQSAATNTGALLTPGLVNVYVIERAGERLTRVNVGVDESQPDSRAFIQRSRRTPRWWSSRRRPPRWSRAALRRRRRPRSIPRRTCPSRRSNYRRQAAWRPSP